MARARVPETDQGIQGEVTVHLYDQMQRRLRDKGWIETKKLIRNGIAKGAALEIGPGPGYLGLEWLKNTQGTTLKGLDISTDMIEVALRNASDYRLSGRVQYVEGSGEGLPFDDESFDAVFTAGSLHEWRQPKETLAEIWRVLRQGGKVFVADLRRDMSGVFKWGLWLVVKPKAIRPGLLSSIGAAYTPDEVRLMLGEMDLATWQVDVDPTGLQITGCKGRGRGMAFSHSGVCAL